MNGLFNMNFMMTFLLAKDLPETKNKLLMAMSAGQSANLMAPILLKVGAIDTITKLTQKNAKLKAQVAALTKENEELKDQVANLQTGGACPANIANNHAEIAEVMNAVRDLSEENFKDNINIATVKKILGLSKKIIGPK